MSAVVPTEIGDEEVRYIPEYAILLGILLHATEGHEDPLVRAMRKVVTQAGVALNQAYAATQTSDPAVRPEAASALSREDAAPPLPGAGSEPAKRQSSEAVRLMRDNGVTAAQVRLWARHVGREVGDRGGLPIELVQEFLNSAHPKGGTE